LDWEAAALKGNNRVRGNYDEEAELQRALNLSSAEAEFQQGVQQREGTYKHGGGSGASRV
jgi:hypothetical protein